MEILILRQNKYLFFSSAVSLVEAFDASGGVDELLSSGKERVASGTNFNVHVLACGLSLYHIAA